MSIKYLTESELSQLTDEELDRYATIMTNYQLKILAVMDLWVDAYNITSDEYDRRNGKIDNNKIYIKNDSTTKH